MRKLLLILLAMIAVTLSMIMLEAKENALEREEMEEAPNDWFFLQRAFPYEEINYTARAAAYRQYLEKRDDIPAGMRGTGWEFGGPLNIGGRISALAMHPSDMDVIYAGAASGGIFKSTNGGSSWTPVFENAMSLSIGDIAIANNDPQLLFVGTGEANAGGGSMTYDGDGVYKSQDGGESWEQIGLDNIGSVGRVAIDPLDDEVVYVAAMGRLFSKNTERGLYKSTDGGASWQNVLYLSDSTGAIDVVIHPLHPDTVYAVMWERVRTPNRRHYGGTTSGVYRSYNGGDTWEELTNGLPNNSPYVGRIGIDISISDPDILYLIYADEIGYFDGVYRSTNGGDSWARTNDGSLSSMYASYGWWFGRIVVDPVDPDIAYAIGYDLYKTTNGGASWSYISGPVHVDHHDLIVHPLDHNSVVLGNDGGVYLSDNAGSSWDFLDNLPITQFYTCEVDEQYPERFYGGAQDNGTNRTFAAGLGNWTSIYGGDGFRVLVDPVDNNYVYAEYQYGNLARSTNGGSYFSSAMSGISSSDRKNWNTPYVIDPNNPQILYYGANRLYKTTNRASNWQAVSSDLTSGAGNYNQVYGTITTIAVAPSNSSYIYVGTDDGNAWRTADGGGNWTGISSGLPLRWVSRVAVDPYDEETVYISLSGYRNDSYQPHVFRSTNGGDNWTDISGDLPEAPVNDVIVDPSLDSTLYIATDFGVYLTRDLGQHWTLLGDNLPNVPIVDLRLHQPTRKLVAATYGRSMYSFNLDQLVGVEQHGPVSLFSLLPNPATDRVRVQLQSSVTFSEYQLLSSDGNIQQHASIESGKSEFVINLEGLSPGIYFVKLLSQHGSGVRKLIIR